MPNCHELIPLTSSVTTCYNLSHFCTATMRKAYWFDSIWIINCNSDKIMIIAVIRSVCTVCSVLFLRVTINLKKLSTNFTWMCRLLRTHVPHAKLWHQNHQTHNIVVAKQSLIGPHKNCLNYSRTVAWPLCVEIVHRVKVHAHLHQYVNNATWECIQDSAAAMAGAPCQSTRSSASHFSVASSQCDAPRVL